MYSKSQPVITILCPNLCWNLAANSKNKNRKAEEDEESTQRRMTSKQVCVFFVLSDIKQISLGRFNIPLDQQDKD